MQPSAEQRGQEATAAPPDVAAEPPPSPRFGTGFTISTLQAAVGLLQAVVGAMMLVVPHQLSSPAYAALQPNLASWGTAFVLAGAGLLAVAVLRPPRYLEASAHLLSAAAWATLASSQVAVGGWVGPRTSQPWGWARSWHPSWPPGATRAGRRPAGTSSPWSRGSAAP